MAVRLSAVNFANILITTLALLLKWCEMIVSECKILCDSAYKHFSSSILDPLIEKIFNVAANSMYLETSRKKTHEPWGFDV